ncbi:MAG TPA: pyridoxamine 5'-phosphate oxidase family protein [Dehalococcoidia bacterium]|nr:pyridoxamine 5'-phosphate oxidase family protein [Dehalococcoidia bacterium]
MNEKVHDYHDGNRQLQDRFDTRRLADHLTGRVTETIGESQKEFIEKADMFFLATCDHRGLPTCSYKGGDPGFVRVLDEKWLAFPNYDGNGKFQSMGNLLKNPNVGMLFVDFEGQQRLRLQGIATILDDDELLSQYPEAQFMIRVQATEVYTNCPRYVHKYQLVERSVFVPRQGLDTPVPEYKKREDLQEYLPARDRRPV